MSNKPKNNDQLKENMNNIIHMDSQFSEASIYVREDDQDWGSSGMNNVEQSLDIIK